MHCGLHQWNKTVHFWSSRWAWSPQTLTSTEGSALLAVDCNGRSCRSFLLKQINVSNKRNFFLMCPSEKFHFTVRIFRRYVACEKRVIYLLLWLWGGRICHNLCSCSLLPLDFSEFLSPDLHIVRDGLKNN